MGEKKTRLRKKNVVKEGFRSSLLKKFWGSPRENVKSQKDAGSLREKKKEKTKAWRGVGPRKWNIVFERKKEGRQCGAQVGRKKD